MEAEDKVLVAKEFLNTVHGQQGCTSCHGGVEPAASRKEAHQGMVAEPSAQKDSKCATCHADAAGTFEMTLHKTSRGIVDLDTGVLAARINPEKADLLQKAVDNHCASCHIDQCGDCHVSRPQWSGGGLIQGHVFQETPNPILNCTACHGSRVQKEMLGQGPSDFEPKLKPSVHWVPAGMQCVECHTKEWIHGPSTEAAVRYEVKEAPRCEDCHVDDTFYDNAYHKQHAEADPGKTLLQCQVCHSQPYNNCYGCHVGKDDKGLAYFKTDKSEFDFKIGRNPLKSQDRPYDYVVVRHVPVARDTFAFYGEDLLSNFDASPTWKYATPHNIVKVAPQAESCGSCHGNEAIFLLEENVAEDEREANREVIVPKPPPKF